MSMMEPDDAEWMPADDPAAQGGWMNADQYDERVWGMPPRPPPGVRPPTGQLPGRPVWPFWGYWGYRLRNAQRDIKYLAEVVNDILDARLAQLAQTGIPGVTDGSDAARGNVGEFIKNSTSGSYNASPALTDTVVSGIMIPPGDWDVTAFLSLSTAVGGASFSVSGTVPPGMSNSLGAVVAPSAVSTSEWDLLVSSTARANFSVSTLLPFQVKIFNNLSPSSVAGTFLLQVEARRMR